jgi:hypothetical protein
MLSSHGDGAALGLISGIFSEASEVLGSGVLLEGLGVAKKGGDGDGVFHCGVSRFLKINYKKRS